MFYWLFSDYFQSAGLGLRIAGAGVVSFLIVMAFGPRFIMFLRRQKIGDNPEFDHIELNRITSHKSETPTMGGALIVIAMILGILLFANLNNMYVKSGLVAVVWLLALGGVDDWLKLKAAADKTGRDGLKSWEKFVFQVAIAVLLSVFVYRYGQYSFVGESEVYNPAHSFFMPVINRAIPLSFLTYTIIITLVMTGSSNAVNITDGMDGLAAGCLFITGMVFLIISWIVGVASWAEIFNLPFVPFSAEMTVVCSSMLGALLAFMWYNSYPAAVFMGDTGSLPLGGLIGYIAVITRQELVLLVAGGVFVMEILSVIIQVGVFKMTRRSTGVGRRVFKCAPIHHHFHLCGWPETKVVSRMWILAIIFALISLAMLKLG
ncbi:MAG TPA: phospho-N-acetylmuramoyl-pentapeptide-transferase [Phycisphaerae bacterium]|nr:phospho-N-acetylmuramoyl-pentapeptide-transferase [Phycisphaerae bacterium]HPS53316.1 phospho-N-acetylmuramoyl-pentapeptide-transferase [Phycisphaerae bacterium]